MWTHAVRYKDYNYCIKKRFNRTKDKVKHILEILLRNRCYFKVTALHKFMPVGVYIVAVVNLTLI